jgi:hypothetical protein
MIPPTWLPGQLQIGEKPFLVEVLYHSLVAAVKLR